MMKIFRLLALNLALLPVLASAQYTNYSPERMMEELTASLEQVRLSEEALKGNRTTMQTNAVEKRQIDQVRTTYDSDVSAYNSDLAAFNRDVQRYDADCNKKLDKAAFDACETLAGRLEPRKRALDQRLAALNTRKADVNRQVEAWNKKDQARAAAADRLLAEYEESSQHANTMLELLKAQPRFRDDNPQCLNLASRDATHACMQKVFSGN